VETAFPVKPGIQRRPFVLGNVGYGEPPLVRVACKCHSFTAEKKSQPGRAALFYGAGVAGDTGAKVRDEHGTAGGR
jgi:hypothetical protein